MGSFHLGASHVLPLPGLNCPPCAFSHVDRVGVGYGMSSLRDFRISEIS
jgi:hypothetical protein